MLARLAFLAWNQCRLAGDYPATQSWQRRCAEHVLAQEHIRDFMAIPFLERSADLNARYLTDETVLLTACDRLERERNTFPAEVAVEGEALYDWIEASARRDALEGELAHYLAASVSISSMCAGQSSRSMDTWALWCRRSEFHIQASRGAAPLAAVLDHIRLVVLYWESAYSVALKYVDPLIERLETLRMAQAVINTRFLKALLLREIGKLQEALTLFAQVRDQARSRDDLMMTSLALSNYAQVRGEQGRFAEALQAARDASDLAEQSGKTWAVALAEATVGELLRSLGDFELAAVAYSRSAKSHESIGMTGMGVYTRVLAAESLLLAGRFREATAEILVALPVIESHRLTQEGAAAVAILREAIQRQQADPDALRQLREQLQLMRREGKL